MRETPITNARLLAMSALTSPMAHYEVKKHGLLGTSGTTCDYEIKRYTNGGRRFKTRMSERDLLNLLDKPTADLLMTVELSHRLVRTKGFAGPLVVQSAIGVFGSGSPLEATHIVYGSRAKPEALENGLADQIAYAQELILPTEQLETAIEKGWDCHLVDSDPNAWGAFIDLVLATERKVAATSLN
ncbi:MAG: hypothetical protein U0520_03890 [Candidatus Saccharimonadales bacterium]